MRTTTRFGRGSTLLSIVLVAVLGASGWAIASSSRSARVTACANKKTGVLRLKRKKCLRSERQLSWSEAGQAGAPGAPGAPGGQGPPGPSTAYATVANTNLGGATVTGTADAPQTVATLGSLRAGSYVLIAKTRLQEGSTATTDAECDLYAGADHDGAELTLGESGAGVFRGPVSMTLTHTFPSDGSSADVRCFRANSGEPAPSAYETRIVAVRVGDVVGP